jgi:hypothetical protein
VENMTEDPARGLFMLQERIAAGVLKDMEQTGKANQL